ncbi:Unknown protein, partial [Striga hermonthica]
LSHDQIPQSSTLNLTFLPRKSARCRKEEMKLLHVYRRTSSPPFYPSSMFAALFPCLFAALFPCLIAALFPCSRVLKLESMQSRRARYPIAISPVPSSPHRRDPYPLFKLHIAIICPRCSRHASIDHRSCPYVFRRALPPSTTMLSHWPPQGLRCRASRREHLLAGPSLLSPDPCPVREANVVVEPPRAVRFSPDSTLSRVHISRTIPELLIPLDFVMLIY